MSRPKRASSAKRLPPKPAALQSNSRREKSHRPKRQQPHPDDEMNMIALIENAGSDHLPTFGGKFEGGYHIQQNPAEFANLLMALKGRPIKSYLQIGNAAGGSERLICEYLGIVDLTIIDD